MKNILFLIMFLIVHIESSKLGTAVLKSNLAAGAQLSGAINGMKSNAASIESRFNDSKEWVVSMTKKLKAAKENCEEKLDPKLEAELDINNFGEISGLNTKGFFNELNGKVNKEIYQFLKDKTNDYLQKLGNTLTKLVAAAVAYTPCKVVKKSVVCGFELLESGPTALSGSLTFKQQKNRTSTVIQMQACFTIVKDKQCSSEINLIEGDSNGITTPPIYSPEIAYGLSFFVKITELKIKSETTTFNPNIGVAYLNLPIASIIYGQLSIQYKPEIKIIESSEKKLVKLDIIEIISKMLTHISNSKLSNNPNSKPVPKIKEMGNLEKFEEIFKAPLKFPKTIFSKSTKDKND